MQPLTIVTVTYNSSAVIGRMLASVQVPGVDIVVVDNGSLDNSQAVAKTFPEVRVIAGKNAGYGRGANAGFAQATTPYVLLVNPDVVFAPGAVEAMVACMEAHPDVGILGAQMFYRGVQGEKIYTSPQVFDAQGMCYVEWIVGALMLIRRDALAKVGGFDENIFLFYEETDLCKRFVDAGYKLAVLRDAEAEHAAGSSSPSSLRVLKIKAWHSAWSKAYYYRKHFSAGTYWHKIITKLISGAVRVVRALCAADSARFTKNWYELRGTVAFVAGVPAFCGDVGRLT